MNYNQHISITCTHAENTDLFTSIDNDKYWNTALKNYKKYIYFITTHSQLNCSTKNTSEVNSTSDTDIYT